MERDHGLPARRGSRSLGDVLGELVVGRGLVRVQATGDLEAAWAEAAGPEVARHSRVAGLRHGVLQVTVVHPAQLEELVAFRKQDLLVALRCLLPNVRLRDLRFRVGEVGPHPLPQDTPVSHNPPRPGPTRRRPE
jgi:predicted nucleic acid-binding Zn ribbon protein